MLAAQASVGDFGGVKQISVVIPVRAGGNPTVTLESLARQTFRDFEVIIAWDRHGNANWARNRGAELARAPLLLFSDDDIRWEPHGVESLYRALEAHPEASYAYGAYAIGDWVQCNRPWNARLLRQRNYISTMSLIRREHFPGFDPAVRRLQDWDLWLTMLAQGRDGFYCEDLIFRTEKGNGITYGRDAVPYRRALDVISRKHRLIL